ncbi:unnamed protein product [Aphis gossypii]|uniref:BESS domain-containing protein n=1 Tax=Aphis gossypii TaxID=80765 RepID=A0A9P0J742_APHGO|nr:unnamed protein product [Aphis gossypii]
MPCIKADNELSVLQKNESMVKTVDEDYKDKMKKNLAWIKVVSYLINLIRNKNEEQQKIILQDIMARWHIICENHVGHFKKQEKTLRTYSAAKKPKLHVNMEQLSFPKKNRELRNTTSSFEDFHITISEAKSHNINEPKAEQNLSSYTDDKIRYHEVVKNSSSLSKRKKNKHNKFNVEESLAKFLKNHNNMKKTFEEEDDDLEFLYSILPTVRSLTSDQKFSFRIQTMQFLYNIINSNSINRSIQKSSVTSSITAYYSEFFPNEISNDNNV